MTLCRQTYSSLPAKDNSYKALAVESLTAKHLTVCDLKIKTLQGPSVKSPFIYDASLVSDVTLNVAEILGHFSIFATSFTITAGVPASVSAPFTRIKIGTVQNSMRPIAQSNAICVGESSFYIVVFVVDPNGDVFLQDATGQGVAAGSIISVPPL